MEKLRFFTAHCSFFFPRLIVVFCGLLLNCRTCPSFLSISWFVLSSSWKSYSSALTVDSCNQFWDNVEFFNFLITKCQKKCSVGSLPVQTVTWCKNCLSLRWTVWPFNKVSYFNANWVRSVHGKSHKMLQASTRYRM